MPPYSRPPWIKKLGYKQVRSAPLFGGWKPVSPEEKRLGFIGTTALRLLTCRRARGFGQPIWYEPGVRWNQWLWDEHEEKRTASSG